eukprot:1159784-Pelagomonas_calceolata.AAC.7
MTLGEACTTQRSSARAHAHLSCLAFAAAAAAAHEVQSVNVAVGSAAAAAAAGVGAGAGFAHAQPSALCSSTARCSPNVAAHTAAALGQRVQHVCNPPRNHALQPVSRAH